MNLQKKLFKILGLLIIIPTAAFLAGCGEPPPPTAEDPCFGQPCPSEVNLTIWRLFDDREVLEPIIETYADIWKAKTNTTINITYKKVDYENYEERLIKALAAGKGPDIFQIHNDWLPEYWEIISPIPGEIMTTEQYHEKFVEVAYEDFFYQDSVYAIPFSVDTLALFYNPRILEDYLFFSPPTTWEQFIEQSQTVTEINNGIIDQSGASLGTAGNINRATDILYALMLQNDTLMTSPDRTSASFALPTKTSTGENFYPGQSSLDFYTSFANPNHENYTWSPNLVGSIEAFEKGLVAMTINYSYQIPTIDKFKDPDLSYKVANLPQIYTTDDPVSYANYWGETVSVQSQNAAWAWDFLNYIVDNQSYNTRTGSPTSLRQKAKDSASTFNHQAFYAKSFYKIDAARVDEVIYNMINDVTENSIPSEEAINKAQNDVTAMMIKAKEEQL
ncbi:extracellular solute-binding protein [Patescibacteria group bacterium]|nr:extracellular solute-binding protein [Patescibacteria group bacterium]